MRKIRYLYMYYHLDDGIFYLIRKKTKQEASRSLEKELHVKNIPESHCSRIYYLEYLIMKLPFLPEIKIMDLDHKERGVRNYGKG